MNSTDFRTMSDVRLQINLERRLAKRRAAEAKRAKKFGMRRLSDTRSALDAWRGPAWGYVAYVAMLAGGVFLMTPWGRALLLSIWGSK